MQNVLTTQKIKWHVHSQVQSVNLYPSDNNVSLNIIIMIKIVFFCASCGTVDATGQFGLWTQSR